LIVAIAIVELIFPVFTAFVGKEIDLRSLDGAGTLLTLMAFVVFTGIAAGSYPAFFLSGFRTASVLKGDLTRGKAGVLFRNVLVVAQFSISIVLIVATATVFLQMRFARNTDLGFQTEQVVVLEGTLANGLGPRWREMEDRLEQHPGIVDVSSSGSLLPLRPINFTSSVAADGRNDEVDIYYYGAGPNFFETYGMEVLAGRTFSEDRMSDQLTNPTPENPVTTAGYVLNERAVQELGWTVEEALGKVLRIYRREISADAVVTGTVIGVVRDAWLESVREPVKPLYFYMPADYAANSSPGFTALSIWMSGTNTVDTLAFIDSTWRDFNPEVEVRRRFLDQDFAALYAAENQQGQMFMYFSGLAIVLACVGLFGLAAFNAERRTKEIGVRKVMGGSVWSIVLLLTNDFSKLVLISNVIAWPLAYVAMERWLETFAYRIDLTPLIFIGSGLIALCIAWVTVGGTAAKAASARPVLALRYE
jgi:putative ABC transport system permease protein